MKLKIEYNYPPNYDRIINRFPSVKGRKGIIFTYGDTVYIPRGKGMIPDHLKVHEKTHIKQQINGPEFWWNKYLENDEFRLSQEVEAYQNQYNYYCQKDKSLKSQRLFLRRIAMDLSSAIYGNMIEFEQAKKLIKKGNK